MTSTGLYHLLIKHLNKFNINNQFKECLINKFNTNKQFIRHKQLLFFSIFANNFHMCFSALKFYILFLLSALIHISYKIEGGSEEPPFYFTVKLLGIIQQSIAAVISAVYHCKGTSIIFIPECEETVIQQIHLQYCLFPGHGPEIEVLFLGDFQAVLLILILNEGGLIILERAAESILTQTACKASLILTDLPLNGAYCSIDGCKHIGCTLACPEPGTCPVNGKLYMVLVVNILLL